MSHSIVETASLWASHSGSNAMSRPAGASGSQSDNRDRASSTSSPPGQPYDQGTEASLDARTDFVGGVSRHPPALMLIGTPTGEGGPCWKDRN